MSEVEYDLLLETVQTAFASAPEDDFVVQTQRFFPSPRAANDNGRAAFSQRTMGRRRAYCVDQLGVGIVDIRYLEPGRGNGIGS